jgi:hypothetical protein
MDQGNWPFLSALALQYPKKPILLEDDLESPLYILMYCAARFHFHSLSDNRLRKDTLYNELIEINSENEDLAQFVSTFFYEEFAKNGYRIGGRYKKAAIKAGKSPLTIDPIGEVKHPFMEVIDKLYDILHARYSTFDYNELQQYSIKEPPKHVEYTKRSMTRIRLNRMSSSLSMTQSLPRTDHGADSTQASSTSSSAIHPNNITHDELLSILHTTALNHPSCHLDKGPDQFFALPSFGLFSARLPSGYGKSLSDSQQTS